MDKFSINDCVIYWDTRKELTKKAREVIIRDLTGLSTTIEKTLLYLKDTALDKKAPEIRFRIGDSWEYGVFLHIFDGPDPLYYRLCIKKSNTGETVAEIESGKNNIATYVSKCTHVDFFERAVIK